MPEPENLEEPLQGLQQDPLVEKLIPDPSEKHPAIEVVSGFLGKSSLQGHWRLYLTPALDVYLEIPEADIVHNQALASAGNALGGTVLWVKQDANIELHTRTNLRQKQAQLLTNQSQVRGQSMTGEEAASLAASPSGTPNRTAIAWSIAISCWIHCPPQRPFPFPSPFPTAPLPIVNPEE